MDRLEMKQRAVRYYKNNQVSEKLETLLNTMFVDDPQDIYGYMAEYFSTLSKPASITKIVLEESLSRSGYKTLNSTVHCCINGLEKEVCCLNFLKDVRRILPKIPTSNQRHSAKNSNKKEAKGKAAVATKKDQALAAEGGVNGDNSVDTPKYSFNLEHVMELMSDSIIPRLIGSNLRMDCVDEILSQCAEELVASVNPLEPQNITGEPKENADVLEETIKPNSQSNSTQHVHISEKSESELSTKKSSHTASRDLAQTKLEINMASFFVSLLISYARSKVEQRPLYRVLSPQGHAGQDAKEFDLPIPAVNFMTCDHTSPGKLTMFKEVLLLPKPTMDLGKGIDMIVSMFHSFDKELVSKFGHNGSLKNSYGVLTPSFDKPEQVFELLVQTVKNELHVELDENFDLILNVGAHELYDEEKKRYEVMTGSSKPAEELLSLYNSWMESYPIVGLVDPVSMADEHGASMIYKELSSKCFIITSQFSSSERLHELIESSYVDGGVFHPEHLSPTVSDATSQLEFLKNVNGVSMMTDDWNVSQNTCTAVDMSVSMNATFVRVSSLSTTGSSTLRHLLKIACDEGIQRDVHFKDGYEFRTKVPTVDVDDEFERHDISLEEETTAER